MTEHTNTSHRATPEQWAAADNLSHLPGWPCLLELRDRLAAAEQRISELEANHPAKPDSSSSNSLPTDSELRALFWGGPDGRESIADGLRRVYLAGMDAAVCSHIRSSNEGTSYCGLAEQISEAENDRRFQACVKAVDEATPEQIRALTDPTGPLVEAVFDAIVQELNYEAEARAAILTVAAWLRQKYSLHAAELLEQEANR